MKEGTSIREHVLDMMMHFNIAGVNGGAIDEANQVSFILESLPKSFIPFQTNASLNKIEFNQKTLLNELQRFQNLTKGKGKEVEANVATIKGKFKRGSSSKSKVGPSKSNHKIENKGKGKTLRQNKEKKTTEKGKCYHCGENGHWLRNCQKYLPQKKSRERSTRIGRLVKNGLLSLRAKTPFELVHSDLCGPMNVKARGGYKYFINYSRYGHVYLIQNKSDSFEKFKEYKAEVKNESDTPSSSTKVVDKTRNIGQTHHSQELGEPRRSGRVVQQPDHYLGLSEAHIIIPDDGIEDPLTYKQAMYDVDCDQWIKAMDLEMESMYSNSIWTLVDQPNDVKPIGCKWIYKRKRDQAGKVQTFKARLVAKGHLADIKKWLAMQFQMKDLGNA
ncbi:gag/pol protein [Cucumis melo var. makuwa]|uniref:Gag/pol protein n=1 Tax=Cucumis melo var. makuwa TaxID=1194695 RepID=A0A5D3D6M7_CUCMM|nr:gag/pol protein [Cucumis melo var. makuwa]